MDFNGLVADFAARHNVDGLAAEDDAAALDIDGIVVTLVAAGDAVSLSADVGEPPAEGRADFAEMLLEANLQSDIFFAKAPETGTYVVVRRLALASLDDETFLFPSSTWWLAMSRVCRSGRSVASWKKMSPGSSACHMAGCAIP